MKTKRYWLPVLLAALTITPIWSIAKEKVRKPKTFMNLSSTAFKSGEAIPAKFTCDGENVMPPLSIQNIPAHAKSLVLLVEDPDASRGVATHLLAWNIKPSVNRVAEAKLPYSIIGSNDFGEAGYSGPCPPLTGKKPEHRYFYKVLALDGDVNLPQKSKRHDLDKMLKNKIIGESTLVGTYKRVKPEPTAKPDPQATPKKS